MKKEIIRIKLIDRSRFIDSENMYRISFKDSSYRGYDIINTNGHYEAWLNGKFVTSDDTEGLVRKEIDLIEETKPRYLIIKRSSWRTRGKRAKVERTYTSLEEARIVKTSLQKVDGISFIIINNKTWREVY